MFNSDNLAYEAQHGITIFKERELIFKWHLSIRSLLILMDSELVWQSTYGAGQRITNLKK
jgi:hypothetical protein